jgi:hypothetical protein
MGSGKGGLSVPTLATLRQYKFRRRQERGFDLYATLLDDLAYSI